MSFYRCVFCLMLASMGTWMSCSVGGITFCEYEKRFYRVGESFRSTSGNQCQCQSDATVSCRPPDGGELQCEHKKVIYQHGQSVPSDERCTSCTCENGKIKCLATPCRPQCEYEGKSYNSGDSWKASDGCNTCSCSSMGRISCTKKYCSSQCNYGGKRYNEGDSWKASDGCNSCSCGKNGAVRCSLIDCRKRCYIKGSAMCAKDEYCKFDDGSCGAEPTSGTCQKKPSGCNDGPDSMLPYCGCDGKTYFGLCNLQVAGVSLKKKGPCDDSCGGKRGFSCHPDQFCDVSGRACNGLTGGTCRLKPKQCNEIYAPVCGCDGKTYSNSCFASSKGISVNYKGECKTKNTTCKYNGKEYKEGEVFLDKYGCNNCQCQKDGSVSCRKDRLCITCGDFSKPACTKGTYCRRSTCASVNGSCTETPTTCASVHDPVCGCDKKTYSNSCVAASQGMTVDYKGKCR